MKNVGAKHLLCSPTYDIKTADTPVSPKQEDRNAPSSTKRFAEYGFASTFEQQAYDDPSRVWNEKHRYAPFDVRSHHSAPHDRTAWHHWSLDGQAHNRGSHDGPPYHRQAGDGSHDGSSHDCPA
jgi:hypothetical protein